MRKYLNFSIGRVPSAILWTNSCSVCARHTGLTSFRFRRYSKKWPLLRDKFLVWLFIRRGELAQTEQMVVCRSSGSG